MTDRTALVPSAPRMLPKVTDENRPFWTGGAGGQLLVPRCQSCGQWVLPPVKECPACGGPLHFEPTSGRGTVYTFTENAYQFHPDVPPPNLIAIVQLDEQDDLRLATNLVECTAAEVRAGLPVEVLFEQHSEVYYPVFRPAAGQP